MASHELTPFGRGLAAVAAAGLAASIAPSALGVKKANKNSAMAASAILAGITAWKASPALVPALIEVPGVSAVAAPVASGLGIVTERTAELSSGRSLFEHPISQPFVHSGHYDYSNTYL